MNENFQNPLAYDFNGNLINHLQASKGVDYECPECGNVLRIRSGNVKQPHFYHVENIECDGESYWHKIYKKVFSECKMIKTKNQTYKFDRVELEKNFGDIRPDAIGYINDIPHLIEFWHTHKVDVHKAEKIKKMKCICIEIQVQTHLSSRILIEQFLTQSINYRNYIYPTDIEKKIVVSERQNQTDSINQEGFKLKHFWKWIPNAPIYYNYKIPTDLKYPCFYYHQVENHIQYIKQIDAKHSVIWLENEWVKIEKSEPNYFVSTLDLLLWQRLLPATIENSEKNVCDVLIQHSDGSGSIYKFHPETNQLINWILADSNGELIYECKFFIQDNFQRAYKNSLGEKYTCDYNKQKGQYIWRKL